MNLGEFNSIHNDGKCGGPLTDLKIYVTDNYSVLVMGTCQKCGELTGLSYSLKELYMWSKDVKAWLPDRKPVKPPLAHLPPPPEVPRATFNDDDTIEGHGLGIKYPDEAAS